VSTALPGKADCCWSATAPPSSYPRLARAASVDVAVVGAGIVGLTTAYLLARAGLSVAVLEARRVGRQVTGRSTAKVTSQHSLIYRHLRDTFDLDTARLYAEANRAGVRQIRDWVDQLGIVCDFEQKDAYAYTCDPARAADIEKEAVLARQLGFCAEAIAKAPLPFATSGALRFPNEAQFNPTQYLVGLAAAVAAKGGRIFENTRVGSVDPSKRRWRITAGGARLDAEHVVVATNLPIAGPVTYDGRTQPRGHLAMPFPMTSDAAIDGMFIGIDLPTHSLRMGRDRDGLLLVVLGPRFNTGQDGDVAARFRELEGWTRDHIPVGAVAWRWVNEDYDTADRVPFIGAPSKKARDFYIATGFNGWGISNGTAAGLLIADQIRGRANPMVRTVRPKTPFAKEIQQGRRHAVVGPEHRRYSTRPRRRDQAWQRQDRGVEDGGRRSACPLCFLHAHGLYGDVEQRRPHLGLPVPRLDLLGGWTGNPRTRDRTAGRKEATIPAHSPQAAFGLSATSRMALTFAELLFHIGTTPCAQ
jgi:glycine/D-amino acid oxidase-like deaminating enzyme